MVYLYSPASFKKEWELVQGVKYNMPIWEYNEIKSLANYVTNDTWLEKYRIFGGIPRYIFTSELSHKDLLTILEERIYNADLFKLNLNVINQSHMIMHRITIDTTYTAYEMVIASEHIRKAILDFAERTEKESTIKFLEKSTDMPLLAGVRGQLYEPVVHKWLSEGGQFTYRKYGGESKTIEFDPISHHQFLDKKFVPNRYCVPASPTQHTVDAICGNLVFQVTVKASRKPSVKGISS